MTLQSRAVFALASCALLARACSRSLQSSSCDFSTVASLRYAGIGDVLLLFACLFICRPCHEVVSGLLGTRAGYYSLECEQGWGTTMFFLLSTGRYAEGCLEPYLDLLRDDSCTTLISRQWSMCLRRETQATKNRCSANVPDTACLDEISRTSRAC